MDNIITQIINIILKEKKQIITISETSHWSYTSHTFHYKLLKSLHSIGFTCFSSERLGILDSFLMNKWLYGKINCSLDYLYKKVLLFGGLGTYRWMQYFKKQNQFKFYLVGCEMDQLDSLSYEQKRNITKILNQFTSQRVDMSNLIKWEAKNYDDRIIKYAINIFYRHGWEKRLNFWLKHMKQAINTYGNLFINGFHLTKAKNELGRELIKCYQKKVLILGMDSLNIFHPVVFITPRWLKKHKLTESELWSIKFWNAFSNWYISQPYNVWIKNIDNLNKYIENHPNVQQYNGYFLVKTNKIKAPIYHYGASPVPVVKGKKIPYYDNKNHQIKDYYDYIIYIPISKFNKDMRQ